MAVIIDDFEVVVEPPPAEPGADAAPQPQKRPETPGTTPQDVRDVMRAERARCARLYAH